MKRSRMTASSRISALRNCALIVAGVPSVLAFLALLFGTGDAFSALGGLCRLGFGKFDFQFGDGRDGFAFR